MKLKKILTAGKRKAYSLYSLLMMALTMLMVSQPAAAAVTDSKLFSGTKQLLEDLTTWMIGIAVVVGGCFIVYFLIRRGMADEMDQVKYTKRAQAVGICTILAVTASGLLKLVLAYFQ